MCHPVLLVGTHRQAKTMITAANGRVNLPTMMTAANSFENGSHSTEGLCKVNSNPCGMPDDSKYFQMQWDCFL